MTHGGLFEGIGGFSLAARWMGWETAFWCEKNEFCQKVLTKHFPRAKAYDDITTADFSEWGGKIDILTGGFPCQPFSVAGKRMGENDDRHLWPSMLEAIRLVRPTWIVGENVAGILSMEDGATFERICTDLEGEGYAVQAFVIPAAAVQAWHRRDRVWIIAHTNKSSDEQDRCSHRDGRKGAAALHTSRQRRHETRIHSEGCDHLQSHKRFHANDIKKRCDKMELLGESPKWKMFGSPGAHGQIVYGERHIEPIIRGSIHGLSAGLDGSPTKRKQALGNAVVPQVPYELFKAIASTDKEQSNQ